MLELSYLADKANQQASQALSRAFLESQKTWGNWVEEALEKGGGKAHRFTKGPSPLLPNEFLKSGLVLDTPASIMEDKAELWSSMWCKGSE
eukprot:12557377-Heterocapsa_arctica.AAC.1